MMARRIEHRGEALAHLGFLLDLAGGDLLAEQLPADLGTLEPVGHPVDGEGLGGTLAAAHRVHPAPGPGHEHEAPAHAAVPARSPRSPPRPSRRPSPPPPRP